MTDARPMQGTPEYDWWRTGARQEAALQVEGMTWDGKRVYDFVHVLAKQGKSGEHIVDYTARVFTCTMPFRARLKLAWRIARQVRG